MAGVTGTVEVAQTVETASVDRYGGYTRFEIEVERMDPYHGDDGMLRCYLPVLRLDGTPRLEKTVERLMTVHSHMTSAP
ncbi:hypothetical protein LTR50_003936 [Elasticomyces elasticus]|nr:hypothetical protein LTR50_003936 [Elasticomyces elasticus]